MSLSDERISEIARQGIDALCLTIQTELGVKTGDFASVYFSGVDFEQFVQDYIRGEINRQESEKKPLKKLFVIKETNSGKAYGFEFGGTAIEIPTISECGRFPVSPEYYGFEVMHTGGGCTAHGQVFDLDGKRVLMLITDQNLNHIDSDSINATIGLYDEDMESIADTWDVSR